MRREDDQLQIGPSGDARRLFGWLAFVALFAITGGAFIWMFVLLTRSWQIAIGSTVMLIGFMALAGWLAERSGKGDDNAMR